VTTLHTIVQALRTAWPNVLILVRGDSGLATPEVYEFCASEGRLDAFGSSSNAVLKERTAQALADLETYYAFYQQREPAVQRFEVLEDYQADSWSRPRRIVGKIEINRHGSNRRFVVTNLSGQGQGIYHGFYVQRGDVPERPIGELKNGLHMDRLSFHRFRANGLKLLSAHAGVRAGRAASGSDGGDPGSGPGGSGHAAAAVVESRRDRSDQRAAELVPLLDELAQPRAICARVPGGAAVRAESACGGGRLADCRSPDALITVPKFHKAARRRPVEIPCKKQAKSGLVGGLSKFLRPGRPFRLPTKSGKRPRVAARIRCAIQVRDYR